jgi:ubiquinol-cytochrome c reductase cytochrome b subunit
LLPALLIAFLGLHIYVFRRHGITVPDPDRAPTTTFWPDQVLKDAVACLAVLATVLLLAIYKGADLSAPANPTENYRAARPEWYFLFLFRFLKFEWVEEHGLAFGAIYVPGALMAILFLMPIIALWKWGHRFNQVFAWAMCGVIVALTGMAFYEDSKDEDHQAAIEKAHLDAKRVMEIAGNSNSLIPVEGAVTMLPNDPLIQGPKIFAKNCAGCHHFHGFNGQGVKVTEVKKNAEGKDEQVDAQPVAVDLGTFGSREWMKSILTNYPEHFAPLKYAAWYQEAKKKEEAGEEVAYLKVDEGDMVDFSNDAGQSLKDGKNHELDAVAEYFAREAIQADVKDRKFDPPAFNADLAQQGEKIIEEGKNYEGILASGNCYDCHGQGAPDITDYGSAKWLKSFILNPGAEEFYGDKNRMPSYAGKLSDHELDMLVRWMTGDYAPTQLDLQKLKAQEPDLGQATEESEKVAE